MPTKIEWVQGPEGQRGETWNPVTGCTKVSPGCAHCYAETFAERFRGVPGHPYEQGFDLTLRPARLELPLTWRKPRMIFVNSMSDLFHPEIPDEYVGRVFETMERADWHTFQVLTKRPERALELAPGLPWPANVWMGVSVENRRFLHRLDTLRRYPCGRAVRLVRAAAGPAARHRPDWHRLGHRGRGVGAARASHEAGVGLRPARRVRVEGSALLL